MSNHAVLAPSSAPIWGNCSGSVIAQQGEINAEHPRTRLGTAAHWVAEQCLLAAQDASRRDGVIAQDYLGQTAPNGVIIDDEICEGAQVYVANVLAACLDNNALRALQVEQHVKIPRVHPLNDGTPDAWLWVEEKGTLYIWDYKHGHRHVSPVENLQLIDYAAGILDAVGVDGVADQHVQVVMRIVHPFCYTAGGAIEEWSVKASDLRPHINRLHDKAEEALTAPKLSTGEWCRDCRARNKCSARRWSDYELIDKASEPYEMHDMPTDAMVAELAILKAGETVVKSRREALEDTLKQRIADGETCGLTLETTLGRVEWTCDPEVAEGMAQQMGFSVRKPTIMTPTQAINAAPADVSLMFEQIIKPFTRRLAGSAKLVPVEHSRNARAFKPEK